MKRLVTHASRAAAQFEFLTRRHEGKARKARRTTLFESSWLYFFFAPSRETMSIAGMLGACREAQSIPATAGMKIQGA